MTASSTGKSANATASAWESAMDAGEATLRIRVSRGKAAQAGAVGKASMRLVKASVHAAGKGGGGKTKGQHQAGRGRAPGAFTAAARLQRVTVKARVVVVPKSGGKAAVMRYLGYIEREGGAKDGGVSDRFDAAGSLDEQRLDTFASECATDRHSFRLIVSPEFGAAMDLEKHTRDLMGRMEHDLGTGLDWVAAVHHDTDNPHIHVMVRGVDDRGEDLVISKDYISRGIRVRACELATQELGLRTELDVAQTYRKNLHRAEWVGIDAELLAEQQRSPHNRLDFERTPASAMARMKRDAKLERLGYLRELGVAEEVAPGRWRLVENGRGILQGMSIENARGAMLRPHVTAERATGYDLPDKASLKSRPVRGVVLDRGLANTLTGTEYVVIGGFDGRVHYTTVGHYSERHLDKPAKVGDTVALNTAVPSAAGSADRNVLKRLEGGVYDPTPHLAEVQGWREGVLRQGITPEGFVDAHVKRMDALAGRGHVEALSGGRYRVPSDLLQRLEADPALYRDRQGIVRVDVEARGALTTHARVIAQSFMDGELEAGTPAQLRSAQPLSRSQAAFLDALESRTDRLAELRLASRTPDGGVVLAPGYREALRARELADASARLAATYGQAVNMDVARRFQGTVATIEQLPSGPHAVIVSEDTFALVPARGGLERMAGRAVQVTIPRGATIGKASFQQARLRFLAMDTLLPTRDLGLGVDQS